MLFEQFGIDVFIKIGDYFYKGHYKNGNTSPNFTMRSYAKPHDMEKKIIYLLICKFVI